MSASADAALRIYKGVVMFKFIAISLIMLGAPFGGCDNLVGDPDAGDMDWIDGSSGNNNESGLPPGFDKFTDGVDVSVEGDYIVIRTNGVPNHPSPYFQSNHDLYESPTQGMVVNPNRIGEQNLVFRIPLNPEKAASTTDTPLGPIGVATNGVAFFNQYAGRGRDGSWLPLDNEIATFDKYNGHPAPGAGFDQTNGIYHYHLEPLYLTKDDRSVLIGWSLDGYPICGPIDSDGSTPADLDANNGHYGPTREYPDGIYHYHTTSEPPYIIGGYTGIPGTVSR